MRLEFEVLDFFSFIFFTFVLYFLSVLSKRIGEVMGMRKYYYLYYAGIYFTLTASIIILMNIENLDFYGYISFTIGLTLGLIASIKYWGWLVKELIIGK